MAHFVAPIGAYILFLIHARATRAIITFPALVDYSCYHKEISYNVFHNSKIKVCLTILNIPRRALAARGLPFILRPSVKAGVTYSTLVALLLGVR